MTMTILMIFLDCLWRGVSMAVFAVCLLVFTNAIIEYNRAKAGWKGGGGTGQWGGGVYYYPTDKFDIWGHFRSNRQLYLVLALIAAGLATIIILLAGAAVTTFYLFLAYHHLPL